MQLIVRVRLSGPGGGVIKSFFCTHEQWEILRKMEIAFADSDIQFDILCVHKEGEDNVCY